jgi:predicted GIY-YIG superfamily endonuclease
MTSNLGWGLNAVYIMASRKHGTLYVGVTSELVARVGQHREGVHDGFTKAYGVKRLVWYELHDGIEAAIHREVAQEVQARVEDQLDRARQPGLERPLPAVLC